MFIPLAIATAIMFSLSLAIFNPANAQTVETAAGAQAIALVGGSGGGGSSDNFQAVATTPDSIAPSFSSANGAQSCYVPITSDAVSAVFVSYSGGRYVLDEGCEARMDSTHFANLSVLAAEYGNLTGALGLFNVAVERMAMTREVYLSKAEGLLSDEPWDTVWRP